MKPLPVACPKLRRSEAGDVVEDGIQGIIVPPADVDTLAAAIQTLYDRPGLWSK